MRILLLSQFFQPEPMFKGLPFARALCERGHQVEVLTGFPNYPGGRLYPGYRQRLVQREVMDGVPVARVPLFPSHDRSAVRRGLNYTSFAASAFLQAVRQTMAPDVVYVYNLVTLGPAARRLRRRHGCPIVLDVQDLWPESILNSGMLRRLGPLANGLQRWCRAEYGRADRLIVLSPGFKRSLAARGVSPERLEVIHNWCDEASIRLVEPGPEFRRRHGFHERFNVLFAGTMGTIQGLAPVVEAARLLLSRAPTVRLTLLGGGVEVDALRTRAASLPNVQFLPACPQAEVGAYLGVADALLVHLKRESASSLTIPSKIQAYLHAGKPILCAVEGDAAELVQRAEAGVCCTPEAPEAIAAAVQQLAALSASERRAMGERGRTFYNSELCFARGVDRFEAAFAQTVRMRATAGGPR